MSIFKSVFSYLIVLSLFFIGSALSVFGASCSSTQCFNGSFCEDKPTTNGFYVPQDGKCNVYRYDKCVCNDGTGWSCQWIPLSTGGPISYCNNAKECYVGMRQFKADGCLTKMKSCCNNETWSSWEGVCTNNCSGDTCWNGTSCASRPSSSTQCSYCLYTATYSCSSGSGWQENSRNYTGTCSSTHCVYNGECRKVTDLGPNYTIGSNGYCTSCSSYKRVPTSQGSRNFGSYTEAVNYANANDGCNRSYTQYNAACSGASSCVDLVAYNTPNYTGRWYETSDTISESVKNSSDSTTCSLYKSDPNMACSRKWYGTTYTSTSERSSTCYTNCVTVGSGYNTMYQCHVNRLYCAPVYYVTTFKSDCVCS